MDAGMLRRVILVVSVLAMGGCDRNQPAVMKVNPVPLLQPVVFYDETGDPSDRPPPLSELELQKITDWVATKTRDPIWMIRVKPSFPGGRRAGVLAYLMPTQMAARTREGHAYNVAAFPSEINTPSPWRYVQVSMPEHAFGGSSTKPSMAELPFEWPVVIDPESKSSSPMSVDEVIRIVDFLRQPASYQTPASRHALSDRVAGRRPYELPFLRIRREANTVRVMVGFQHGGLWARGWMITLECTPTEYRMTECSMWVS